MLGAICATCSSHRCGPDEICECLQVDLLDRDDQGSTDNYQTISTSSSSESSSSDISSSYKSSPSASNYIPLTDVTVRVQISAQQFYLSEIDSHEWIKINYIGTGSSCTSQAKVESQGNL